MPVAASTVADPMATPSSVKVTVPAAPTGVTMAWRSKLAPSVTGALGTEDHSVTVSVTTGAAAYEMDPTAFCDGSLKPWPCAFEAYSA